MLKNFGYGGAYRDENLSISVLLENPLDYEIETTKLVFSVVLKDKSGSIPKLEDFAFYIMDESNRLFSAESKPYTNHDTELTTDHDEPVRKPDWLIITDFNHDFLFQDLRIAFNILHQSSIRIIELRH